MAWTRFCTSAGSGVAAWIVVSSTLSSKLRYFLKVRTSRLMLRPVADSIIRLTASVCHDDIEVRINRALGSGINWSRLEIGFRHPIARVFARDYLDSCSPRSSRHSTDRRTHKRSHYRPPHTPPLSAEKYPTPTPNQQVYASRVKSVTPQ